MTALYVTALYRTIPYTSTALQHSCIAVSTTRSSYPLRCDLRSVCPDSDNHPTSTRSLFALRHPIIENAGASALSRCFERFKGAAFQHKQHHQHQHKYSISLFGRVLVYRISIN